MELTAQLGREIIHRLARYIDVPINLMDPSGKIVASTDTTRVDQLHGGAQSVIETLHPQQITDQDVARFSNAKPGVNLPIFHRGELAGVVGLTGEPDKVFQAAGMTQGSVEIALEQMHMQKQAFYQERQWSHWLHQLLHPKKIDETALEKEARYTLRIDLKKVWQVVIFQTEDPFELADVIRQKVELMGIDPLFVLPYEENMVVVPLEYSDQSLPFSFPAYIGVGDPGYGARGIRTSFRQAQQAIKLTGKRGIPVYSKSLKLERLLFHLDEQTYHEVTNVYQQRIDQMDDMYIETLQCYFDYDLKVNQTANQLHIHRNTLIYRLDQLSKKVGLDPRKFKDAIILKSILIKQ